MLAAQIWKGVKGGISVQRFEMLNKSLLRPNPVVPLFPDVIKEVITWLRYCNTLLSERFYTLQQTMTEWSILVINLAKITKTINSYKYNTVLGYNLPKVSPSPIGPVLWSSLLSPNQRDAFLFSFSSQEDPAGENLCGCILLAGWVSLPKV